MLVLSRMENQAIIIGDDVEIIVTEIRGDKVRLGIEAPNYVSIHRKEVYRDIADGKKIPTRRLLRIYTSRLNQFGANSKQCAELVSDNSDNTEFVELARIARLLKLAMTDDAEGEKSA